MKPLVIDGKIGGQNGLAVLHCGWWGEPGELSFQVYHGKDDKGLVTFGLREPSSESQDKFLKQLNHGARVRVTVEVLP